MINQYALHALHAPTWYCIECPLAESSLLNHFQKYNALVLTLKLLNSALSMPKRCALCLEAKAKPINF